MKYPYNSRTSIFSKHNPHLWLGHYPGWDILIFGGDPKSFDRSWTRLCSLNLLLFAAPLDLPEPAHILFTKVRYLLF